MVWLSHGNTITYHWWWTLVELWCKFWISTHKFVECSYQFSLSKTLVEKSFCRHGMSRRKVVIILASPDCILPAVRCMYHQLGLLECSQISQENWQCQNHHLICQSVNPSMTQISLLWCLWDHKLLWADIFEELFKPWVIDTDEVVDLAWC